MRHLILLCSAVLSLVCGPLLVHAGLVVAWGYDNEGQTNVPPELGNVKAVAAGYYHGIDWQLYHLTFGNGIDHELVFELNLLEGLEQKPDWTWDTLSVLGKRNVRDDSLAAYYEQQKLLSPKNVVNLLLGEEMLAKLRQELNRKAPTRLDITAVFEAVRDILSQEALATAGDIVAPSRKRRKRCQHKNGESPEEENEGPEVPVTVAESTPTTQTIAPSAQSPIPPPETKATTPPLN